MKAKVIESNNAVGCGIQVEITKSFDESFAEAGGSAYVELGNTTFIYLLFNSSLKVIVDRFDVGIFFLKLGFIKLLHLCIAL